MWTWGKQFSFSFTWFFFGFCSWVLGGFNKVSENREAVWTGVCVCAAIHVPAGTHIPWRWDELALPWHQLCGACLQFTKYVVMFFACQKQKKNKDKRCSNFLRRIHGSLDLFFFCTNSATKSSRILLLLLPLLLFLLLCNSEVQGFNSTSSELTQGFNRTSSEVQGFNQTCANWLGTVCVWMSLCVCVFLGCGKYSPS